jgi:hypothetical protein
MSALSIWRQNPELMARLSDAQNHEANVNLDIMTFAGMCDTREELERHVLYYEARAANYVAPVKAKRRASR